MTDILKILKKIPGVDINILEDGFINVWFDPDVDENLEFFEYARDNGIKLHFVGFDYVNGKTGECYVIRP